MRSYYKFCLFVIAVCLLNSFGYYCTENNVTYGLNPMWFVIMNIVQTGIGIILFLLVFPLFCIESESEKISYLRDMGDEPYSKMITFYPFAIIAGVNIQLGSVLDSITALAITLFAFVFINTHNSIIKWHITKMAEKGTKRYEY